MGARPMLVLVLLCSLSRAQPVTKPDEVPPLAQIRDDKQLAEALAAITRDPSIKVDNAKNRPLAAALMAEGVRQLHANAYDQALANFLEAYNKFPSPKILLNIASTLRDMGRLADAANTYQRYLTDPATGPERVPEVKAVLAKLDEQLTLVTIRVMPSGSEVSLDGGPFVAVGISLQTRVRPGLHLVRIRNGTATGETTVNGFEGEAKDVDVKAEGAAEAKPKQPVAEHYDGWLITGTQYGTESDSGTTRERHVRSGFTGPVVAPIVPKYDVDESGEIVVEKPARPRLISSGALAILRIDGKGRGFAGGLGIAVTPMDAVELEAAGLRADLWGAYLGIRVRFLTGWLRPYVAGGVPMFFYKDDNDPEMGTHVALGLRGAAGVEVMLNGHLSIQGDLGVEHFFNVDNALIDNKRPDATVFVPTLGVIGRL